MKTIFRTAAAALVGLTLSTGANAAGGEGPPLLEKHFSFEGFFGTYDKAAMQRGFQVYQQVCSGCHGLRLVAFRNLADLGYHDEEISAIAEGYTITAENELTGEMEQRPGTPSDHFPENTTVGAPDLSLVAKAREHGPHYIYSLLQGYEDAPADEELTPGTYWNVYFKGGAAIGMYPPLDDGVVTYADGTDASVAQMSADVSHFLMWAAEPKLEQRKAMGLKVLLFLLVFTGILYAVKRKVWADVDH
jgi:ubiquinol-cytochrome c reductase cytochrome c1 subunit